MLSLIGLRSFCSRILRGFLVFCILAMCIHISSICLFCLSLFSHLAIIVHVGVCFVFLGVPVLLLASVVGFFCGLFSIVLGIFLWRWWLFCCLACILFLV